MLKILNTFLFWCYLPFQNGLSYLTRSITSWGKHLEVHKTETSTHVRCDSPTGWLAIFLILRVYLLKCGRIAQPGTGDREHSLLVRTLVSFTEKQIFSKLDMFFLLKITKPKGWLRCIGHLWANFKSKLTKLDAHIKLGFFFIQCHYQR